MVTLMLTHFGNGLQLDPVDARRALYYVTKYVTYPVEGSADEEASVRRRFGAKRTHKLTRNQAGMLSSQVCNDAPYHDAAHAIG